MSTVDRGPEYELDLEFSAVQAQAERLTELSPDELRAAFEQEGDRVCSCVDEGAVDGGYRLAGAGILHPGGSEAVAKLLRAENVTEVSSHDNCGAAKEAYRRRHGLPADATISPEDVNAFAQAWAEEVAAKAKIRASHQGVDDLHRPAERHEAVVVYVDATGAFRPTAAAEQLPAGFVVSANGLSADDVVGTVAFVDHIARSDHGYGDRFSADQPLRYVLVGEVDPEIRRGLEQRQATDPAVTVADLPIPEEIRNPLVEMES